MHNSEARSHRSVVKKSLGEREPALINLPIPVPSIPVLSPILSPIVDEGDKDTPLIEVPVPLPSIPVLTPLLSPLIGGKQADPGTTTAAPPPSTPTTAQPAPQPAPTQTSGGDSGNNGNSGGGSNEGGNSGGNSGGSSGGNSGGSSGGSSGDSSGGNSGSNSGGNSGSNSGGNSGGDSSGNGNSGNTGNSSGGNSGNGSNQGNNGNSGPSNGSSGNAGNDSSSDGSQSHPSSASQSSGGTSGTQAPSPSGSSLSGNAAGTNGTSTPSSSEGSSSDEDYDGLSAGEVKNLGLLPDGTDTSGASSDESASSSTHTAGSSSHSGSSGGGNGINGGTGSGNPSDPSLPTSGASSSSGKHGLSTGAIVAIAVVGGLALLFLILFLVRRRYKARRSARRHDWWRGFSNNNLPEHLVDKASFRSSFGTTVDRGTRPPSRFSWTASSMPPMPDFPPMAETRSGPVAHAAVPIPTNVSATSMAAAAATPRLISPLGSNEDQSRFSVYSSETNDSSEISYPQVHSNFLTTLESQDDQFLKPATTPLTPMSVRPFSPSEAFSFPKPPSAQRASSTIESFATAQTSVSAAHAPALTVTGPESDAQNDPFSDPVVLTRESSFAAVEVIQRPFLPAVQDEITVLRGDNVRIEKVFDDGWAYVHKLDFNGDVIVSGLIPIDCLREADEELPAFLASKRVSSYRGVGVAA